MRGIHRWPVDSIHEGRVTRKMFPFDDVIMRYVDMIQMINNIRFTKKTSKVCITGPPWGESTDEQWFSTQRANNAESVFISWRHVFHAYMNREYLTHWGLKWSNFCRRHLFFVHLFFYSNFSRSSRFSHNVPLDNTSPLLEPMMTLFIGT